MKNRLAYGKCFSNVTFHPQIPCLVLCRYQLTLSGDSGQSLQLANGKMATSSTTGKSILVVDDDPLVCDAIRLILASDGHRVEIAISSEAALAQLKTGSFDLFIVDYLLPAMKGDKLAEAIKAQHPNLPVALITAYAESLQSARLPLPGVDLVISKPFDTQAFRHTVAGLLSGKAAK